MTHFVETIRSAFARKKEPEHLRRGKLGEAAAKRHLQRRGLKFLTANFRSDRGEIDLIFRDRDCLVFVEGATANGVEEDTANFIFDQMETFAGYGFNKSHSAAYALIAYQTAWLKTRYTSWFMAAVLSSDMDSTDNVDEFVRECRSLELEILPPDVNRSVHRFTAVDDRTVR